MPERRLQVQGWRHLALAGCIGHGEAKLRVQAQRQHQRRHGLEVLEVAEVQAAPCTVRGLRFGGPVIRLTRLKARHARECGMLSYRQDSHPTSENRPNAQTGTRPKRSRRPLFTTRNHLTYVYELYDSNTPSLIFGTNYSPCRPLTRCLVRLALYILRLPRGTCAARTRRPSSAHGEQAPPASPASTISTNYVSKLPSTLQVHGRAASEGGALGCQEKGSRR